MWQQTSQTRVSLKARIYLLCIVFARLQVGVFANSSVVSFCKDDECRHYWNDLEIKSYSKKQKKNTKMAKVIPFP